MKVYVGWIGLAIASMICFGLANFVLKYVSTYRLDPYRASMFMLVLAGAVALIMLISLAKTRVGITKMDIRCMGLLMIAGCLYVAGIYMMCEAMSKGKAGPVVAIVSANAIIVSILVYITLNERLTITDLLAFGLFIAALILFAQK